MFNSVRKKLPAESASAIDNFWKVYAQRLRSKATAFQAANWETIKLTVGPTCRMCPFYVVFKVRTFL